MIDYFYDTEFIEDGKSIELISIGIVSSRGEEYYAVNSEINGGNAYYKIRRHKWLMENVIPHLPLLDFSKIKLRAMEEKGSYTVDPDSPLVKSHEVIAKEVKDFLIRHNEPIRLWTYYGAYDHVVMSWLWGTMMNRPKGIPMFSMDLMQWAEHLGIDASVFPRQIGTQHNALEDAKWNQSVYDYLKYREQERQSETN